MALQIDTARLLRQSPGITTTLVDGDNRMVVRSLDLSQTGPWSWEWLEGELQAVRRARLDHVVPTLIAKKTPHFAELTRPFIAGPNICEWFARNSAAPKNDHLKLMCDLFHALGRLHRIGVAHGGIKPANVIVSRDSDQLLLLDTSMTRTQLAAPMAHVDAREAHYLPSDNHGLAHTVGFTADIFAAGWVLLEALAESTKSIAALRATRTASHAQPLDIIDIVDIPEMLRPVFLKLLSSLPRMRYESADEVLAALEAILATDDREQHPSPRPVTIEHDYQLAPMEPPLVGRYSELAILSSRATRAAHGAGSAMILSGESGVGKTRLLDAVANTVSDAGLAVMRAEAFDHEPARPLGLFAGAFRDVVALLKASPDAAERVQAEMSDLLPTALEYVPGLSDALGQPIPSNEGLGDRSLAAAPTAVAHLLFTVFNERRRGVLLVDDCQWADDLSWQVLSKLASSVARAARRAEAHLSVVCACRPEAVPQIKAWENVDADFIELEPLSASATEALIRSLGRRIPDEVVSQVSRYSRGNPFEALLVFRALLDTSAIRLESDRWVVDENEIASLLPAPPAQTDPTNLDRAQLDVLVTALLNPLSHDARRGLEQAAILRRQFSPGVLARALQTGTDNVEDLLDEAARRGIVRCIAQGTVPHFEFTHDRVREAVLRTLSGDRRRKLHWQAAQALEGLSGIRADYDIAYHLARSGRPEAAVPYALTAGEEGLRHNALDVAESNFRIAEAGVIQGESSDFTTRFRIYQGLGTVHMLRGSYDNASRELTRAYQISGPMSALEKSRVTTLLGELAFKTGRFDDAAKWMNQSMCDLGIRIPRNRVLAATFVVAELTMLAFGWLGRRIRLRRSGRSIERLRLVAALHCRLVYEWWFVRSPVWIVLAVVRNLRFASAAGTIRERAQAYTTAAVIGGLAPPLAPLAIHMTERSLKLCGPADEGWEIAQAHHLRGFALYTANRYDEAIEAFDTAIAAFDIVGDRWEQVAAMWQKALCLLRRGEIHKAGVLARETYWESKRRGDRIGAGTALAIWVRCLPGDLSMETIFRELRQADSDDHTLAMLHWARAWLLFHSEHYVEALDAFRQADEVLCRSKIKNHFLAPILTSHMQVCRLWSDAQPAWTAEHRRLAKETRRLLRRSGARSIVFCGERPVVLREWALMAFSKGHRFRGRLALAASSRSALHYSARGDLAASALTHSLMGFRPSRRVFAALGSAADASDLSRQLGIRVDRGIVESVHSHDSANAGTFTHHAARHQALLDAVSDIVASQDIEEVLDKLRDATFATTTARRVELSNSRSTRWQPQLSSVTVGDGKVEGREPCLETGEMKLTERITKPVILDKATETSVVAAFPLGEGKRYEPTIEVLAALSQAVIERQALRHDAMERIVEVQEAERGRIARDLHDEFGHLFAGVMDGLVPLQNSPDAGTREAAVHVRHLVREGMKVARSVAWSLRPSGLDDLGLLVCIEQYVEDCRHIYPVRIELTTTGRPVPLLPASATAVFRIVQEALTNVGRHSRAREASIIVVFSEDTLRVIVEDSGIGFDVDAAREQTSLGLIGMHERAGLVGGRLVVESTLGSGTTVLVDVPIRR